MTREANARDRTAGNLTGPAALPEPGVWTARVITLVPEAFPGILSQSLTGSALEKGLWDLQTVNLREFGLGRHRSVDDTPAGGGAGMVMRADVIADALDHAASNTPPDRREWPVVCLSPRGTLFRHDVARHWSQARGVTLLCGRFEGIDERVIEEYELEEISIGDFVLTCGEVAAQVLIDATVRLIPRVLGNPDSIEEESFAAGLLEYPQYTRPAKWRGRGIPEVLLSGHHAEIARWRRARSEDLTRARRPDLLQARLKARDESHDTLPGTAENVNAGGPDPRPRGKRHEHD